MRDHGKLICRMRLEKNWSQEGLCKGICTVSYLSKIETGKAQPSEHVLRLLLERLGLHTDPALEQAAADLAEQAYELLFSGEMQRFRALFAEYHPETFRVAAAGMDLALLQQFALPEEDPLEEGLETVMEPRQLALQRILQKRQPESILLLPNGYTYAAAGSAAYYQGAYTSAVELLQTGYDLASREGAPRLMLLCKVLTGNCYCNQADLPNMEKHYKVAARLAAALEDEETLASIAYNTASVQIEVGQYEEAYRYFSALETPELMALHKLAICCEKTGRQQEALAALDKTVGLESEVPPTALARKLCALVRFRLEHPHYLEHEGYGTRLLDCFEACKRELPPGYAAFHLPWVAEWFAATRQYKRAWELLRDFPGKTV